MNGWLDPADFGPHSRQCLGHTWRYYLARGFVEPSDTVLDAACGVGYGSLIMAGVARYVTAIDVDGRAITRAQERYAAPNVEWWTWNLDELGFLPVVDVAVSFETIEHLEYPEKFIEFIKSVARRLLILSVPVVPTVGVNPHHKHDFSEESIRALVLTPPWTLWEEVRQGPYWVGVLYRHDALRVLGVTH